MLNARLMTLLCKKIIVAKSKGVKPGWSNSQEWSGLAIFCGRLWLKKGCFANDDDDDDDDDDDNDDDDDGKEQRET
jgi:hypothetical protein